MTVTYTAEVATCRRFGCFLKLLGRWRGSIYKLVWMDLLVFVVVYYTLAIIYRIVLNKEQQTRFETVVQYFGSYSELIPLSFVLGFFVTIVMQRWWEQYLSIPWPDAIAVYVSAHIHGEDERARLMRRTVMRYVCLSQAIAFSLISQKVKKRFPTMHSFVEVGLLLENERLVFESMDESFPKIAKYWMPIVWAASIITRARKEGRIRDDFAVKTIIDEFNKFRGKCGTLLIYDMIPVPLVYTQVVTIAVYSFVLGCVLGNQWTQAQNGKVSDTKSVDFYFPVFTILQFFFYMGWLKVAESLINPFGEDDDDFEVNWMIDRNLQVSYLIVDEMHQEHPDLVKDQYWDEIFPSELPYEGESKREEHPEPSTTKLGERLAPITVQVDTRRSIMQTVDRAEGRLELLKRMESLASASSIVQTKDDRYSTAASSPASVKSQESKIHVSFVEDVVEPSKQKSTPTLQQTSDHSAQKDKTTEGGEREGSSEAQHVVSSRPSLIAEPESEEKDDFERLKEERERERLERQRIRFVQNIEDFTQITVQREVKPSEPSSELYAITEEEEEDGAEEEEPQQGH